MSHHEVTIIANGREFTGTAELTWTAEPVGSFASGGEFTETVDVRLRWGGNAIIDGPDAPPVGRVRVRVDGREAEAFISMVADVRHLPGATIATIEGVGEPPFSSQGVA